MTGFTKGDEWHVSKKLPYIVAVTAPPYQLRGDVIVSFGSETGGQDWPAIEREEQEANARLVAAAPDLLAACQSFIELWPERNGKIKATPDVISCWQKAKAAIAKAKF